jgi:LCP family protein required for cell wall assembly
MIPRSRGGMLGRFVIAAVLIIAATAATTAVAGLLQVKDLVNDLSPTPALQTKQITLPQPGQPQTILIIGSDHRAGEPFKDANTDTMLLARLNANSATINVLSIPRDLQVQIPGFGTAKINSAYQDGGPGLLIRTIRQNVFPDLKVNHIIDVNFGGFSDLVNAIGCVYADADHRYYNNTAFTNYSSIDVQPGYEKMCGTEALEFVRFRHTDSDIVRNARQQDFIRWAKEQYSLNKLFSNRNRLLRIFGKHAQTDKGLHTSDGLINLFNLVLNADGNTIRQLQFPAVFLPCNSGPTPAGAVTQACYVTSTPGAEHAAFSRFMRATPKPAAKPAATTTTTTSSAGGRHHHKAAPAKIPTAGLTADVTDGQQQAAQLTKLKMPIYFPKFIKIGSITHPYCLGLTENCPVGEGAGTGYYPREYEIHDQHGTPHAAYRMTLALNPVLGQYYGVQGTTWRNPPLLASPSGFKTVGGKRLTLYANGGRLTTVAWHTAQAVYWISNTLTSTIPNPQMIGIAASLMRASG